MRRRWPLAFAIALFLGLLAWEVGRSLQLNGGHLVYPIDDAYTQMTMARTLAEGATYGLRPGVPATASSSPLWVLLLAAVFRVVHASRGAAPLALNTLAGLLLLAGMDRWFGLNQLGPGLRATILAAAVLVIPLPSLAFGGLEHTAHAWLTVVFGVYAARSIAAGRTPLSSDLALAAVAAVLCGIRFEGAFLVAAAAVGFVSRRRWRSAACAVAGGALPIVAHGLYSWSIGWAFVPTSLLLNGRYPDLSTWRGWIGTFGETTIGSLWRAPAILVLTLANAGLVLERVRTPAGRPEAREVLPWLFLGTVLLHGQFAKFGDTFSRYDACLMALGIAAVGPALAAWLARARAALAAASVGRRAVAAVLCLVASWPLGYRAVEALRHAPAFSNETWRQQAQMAAFCRGFLAGRVVAVNDIGLVSYAGNVPVFDLWGLGNIDVARAHAALGRDLTPEVIDRLTRAANADVAMIYDSWYDAPAGIPAAWVRVASWTVDDSTYEADPTVSFYAVKPELAPWLTEALHRFTPSLPNGVTVDWPPAGR